MMCRCAPLLILLSLGGLLSACGEDVTSEEYLARGAYLLDHRQYESAIVELKSALKQDVRQVRARELLGRAYYENGEFDSADKELSRALASGESVDRARVIPLLAQTLLYIGDYDRLQALEIEGLEGESRSTTLAAKGLALLYTGEHVVAEDVLRSATATEPASHFATVAAARLSMEKQQYDVARQRLEEILQEAPEYAPAWNLLGDIEAAQRRPGQAAAAYSQVLKVNPRAFDARLNRVMMRIYLNKFGEARKDLEALQRQHPGATNGHPGYSFAEGILLLQAGRLPQARKAFEKTADFSFMYPLSYYYMAVIDLQEGQLQRALTEIYRFLALAPESVAGPKFAARLELEQEGFVAAENLLLPIVEANPNDVEALNLLANALLGQGRGGEGVDLLARVAGLLPKSAEAKARLGAGYFAAGEADAGIAVLRDTLRENPKYEQADILIVLNFLRAKKIEEALAAAQEYRERNPGSSTAFNLLGRANLAAGELKAAREAFDKALQITPADPAARHGLAEIALQRNQFDAARAQYRRVLKYHENRLPTQLKLAASYALEGRDQEMLNYLQLAIDRHPEAVEPRLVLARYYIAAGQLEAAGPLFDSLTPAQREQPDTLATLASFQLAAKRYNQAVLTLERLLQVRPDVAQYHYLRSKAYAGLGESAKVIPELRRAVELDPDHFYARIALARLELKSGRYRQFNRQLEELKAIAPNNPDVMQLEVALAQHRGNHRHAAELLRRMYEQSPTTANLVALAQQQAGMGDLAGAIGLLEQWLVERPKDTRARETIAVLYEQRGGLDQVIEQYRAIVATEPDNIVALNNLGWYLLEVDAAEALRFAEKAYSLSPESASVLDTLAMAQLKSGQPVAARRTLERAMELAPDSPEMRYHDVLIMVAEGRRQGAVETLSALLDEYGEFARRTEAEAFLKQLR